MHKATRPAARLLLILAPLLLVLACGGRSPAGLASRSAAHISSAASKNAAANDQGGVATGQAPAADIPTQSGVAAAGIVSPPVAVDAASQQVRDDPEVQAVLAQLESRIESEREQRGIGGLSVAVVYDQSIIWSEGFGNANAATQTPATPETLYRVGSLTKLFTDTMLMQLRDEGKLQLDDPIKRYLPDFDLSTSDASSAPTFHEIASHTSGLPREAPLNYWRSRQFPMADELVASLQNTGLLFRPGTGYQYSNLAVAVMGHALEEVAGEPYRQYVTNHILVPLGMSHSGFDLNDSIRGQFAHGPATVSNSLDPYPDFAALTPAAGLYSTVEDMSRFISLQFRDGPAGRAQVLSGSTLQEMRSPASRVSVASDFAVGWELGGVGGHASIGHPGVVYGFTTQVTIVPDMKLGIAVFTNARTNPSLIADDALRTLIPPVSRAIAQ